MADEKLERAPIKDTLHAYWRASSAHKKELILSFVQPIGAVLMTVAVAFYAGKVLAGIIVDAPNLTSDLVLLALCSIGGILANRIGFLNIMALVARTSADINRVVFERLLNRSISFHTNRISGKLVSDALDYEKSYGTLTQAVLVNGLGFMASLAVGIVLVFINSWQLGLFITFVVGVMIGWVIIDSRRRSLLRSKRLAALKKLTSHLSDSIVNAQTVKTFAQETNELKQNQALNANLEELRVRDWQRSGRSGSNRVATLLTLQFAMMLLILHLSRSDPAILATGIFAFTYTMTLTTRLFELNALTRQVEEAILNASPMTRMLRENVEIIDKPGADTLKIDKGQLDISDLSFAYADSAQGAVFRHFNLLVKPGEKIGLVGPSGGGKSTLTRLLLRFDDIQNGQIAIDGQNIAEVTQSSLRANVAFVPQEPLLFHRSVRDNIAYGKPNASEEQIVKAAKRANAHDFIMKLPEGYDTIVGERGVKLSGGQRQRVAIARAILKDAPILILDEATSALDSENEIQVQEALWHLMQNRTTIVIAHRLSTIQKMDRIVVLEDGQISEQGSHKQLLKQNGTYARLWAHQSGGFIEE